MSPKKLADANKDETLETLGISETVDKNAFDEILEKVKSGNIEFYYDKKYFHKEFKNNISVQISSPLVFTSMQEVNQACEGIPAELEKIFGEPVKLHSCKYVKLNGWPVFHHAYSVPSQNLTIINENVHVNKQYSIMFVGGSGNGMEGLHRSRAVQQTLIESVISLFKTQNKVK